MSQSTRSRAAAPSADIRLGIVGMGARAAIAKHVATSPVPARVVAAADISPAGATRARAAFPDALVVSSVSELIAAEAIDAAIIATPDWTHAEIACELLRAGVAVYIEKPLATSVGDADAILATAAQSGTPLYVGHNFRHAAVVRRMLDVIDRGEIGEVKAVWCRHFVGHGGDFYFKDWHADRRKVNSLLVQKGCHDIDVIHLLAGGFTSRVVGMGTLSVYGDIADRADHSHELVDEWLSYDNWPPATQQGLNPIVDVEDLSMVLMTLDNGVMASYEQCHFSPDYWRNYTVIGTEGRLENIGDTGGGLVRVWNRRRDWDVQGDREYPIGGVRLGHDDADQLTMHEFLRFLAHEQSDVISPLAARAAVAAAALATTSLRKGSVPLDIPVVPAPVLAYFAAPGSAAPSTSVNAR